MKKEKSCGGIIFRRIQGDIEFLIIQQQGGHWFFPKGHVEINESEEQTALREIYEEVKLAVKIMLGFRESISYSIEDQNIDKTVVFFCCECLSGQVVISDELRDYEWLNYEQALKKLTHDDFRSVLTKAYNFLTV